MRFSIVLAILIGLAFWLITIYNKLQKNMQDIREGFSNLQAGLKKRQHLSGQIIEIASGYLEHEQLTQLKVAQSRQDMKRMLVLAESYPALKADHTYQQLMQQLEGLENDILKRREAYNQRVKIYNSYRNSFPVVLVAKKLSFDIVQYFDNDDEKFDLQAQTFARDDSEALQHFIGSSKKAMSEAANQTVKNLSQGVGQLRQFAEEKYAERKHPTGFGQEPYDPHAPEQGTPASQRASDPLATGNDKPHAP